MKPVERRRDALEMFFYILLRDYLPSGQVEEIMMKHIEKNPENTIIRYSNPYIVQHVDDLLDRMFFYRQKPETRQCDPTCAEQAKESSSQKHDAPNYMI